MLTSADYKIEKRPLLHSAIASPYASATDAKIVYISAKTPFMSAVKRVQKLLKLVEDRETQSATAQVHNSKKRKFGDRGDGAGDIERIAAAAVEKKLKDVATGNRDAEEVILKATGRAIDKALGLALWFQQRDEYIVRIQTGSVGAIDDIVAVEGQGMDDLDKTQAENAKGQGEDDQEKTSDEPQQDMPVPDSRIRHASVVHVAVSLR